MIRSANFHRQSNDNAEEAINLGFSRNHRARRSAARTEVSQRAWSVSERVEASRCIEDQAVSTCAAKRSASAPLSADEGTSSKTSSTSLRIAASSPCASTLASPRLASNARTLASSKRSANSSAITFGSSNSRPPVRLTSSKGSLSGNRAQPVHAGCACAIARAVRA